MHGLGLFGGGIFVVMGLATAGTVGNAHIPVIIGLIWILVSAIGLSVGGLPTGEVVDDPPPAPRPIAPAAKPAPARASLSDRLRELDHLRRDGLIDDDEFQRLRQQILERPW